jgi:integrase
MRSATVELASPAIASSSDGVTAGISTCRGMRSRSVPGTCARCRPTASARRVSAPSQTQALCAILFLYKNVLGREIGELELVHARRRRKIPVVLTREEVRAVLDHLEGVPKLFCTLLYGTGLRLMEGLRLRCGAL